MSNIYPNLVQAMREKKVSRKRLTEELGISKEALSRRFRGVTEWKLHEIAIICELLGTTNAVRLFLRLDTKPFQS